MATPPTEPETSESAAGRAADYGEPWERTHSDDGLWVVMRDRDGRDVTYFDQGDPEAIARLDREVACVNACQGLNPTALRELIEAARDAVPYVDGLVEFHPAPNLIRLRDRLRSALTALETSNE